MILTFFTGENFKFILVEFLKNKLYFRAISDLQNSCEYSRESPYSLPCFLLLLTPYISVAHFHNNGILLWLRIYTLFRFPSFFFYLMCLFSSRIPCRIPHYINCHISLGSFWLTDSQSPRVFDEFEGVLVRNVPHLGGLSEVFLLVQLGWWVLGSETRAVKYCFHHISSIWPVTVDANPDRLADVVSVRFLYCNDAL